MTKNRMESNSAGGKYEAENLDRCVGSSIVSELGFDQSDRIRIGRQ